MDIVVKLFANLRKDRFEQNKMSIQSNDTIGNVLKTLNIQEHEVTIIFLNGRHSTFEAQLKDGDILSFFPPVGGG